jgi:hypothetical protein
MRRRKKKVINARNKYNKSDIIIFDLPSLIPLLLKHNKKFILSIHIYVHTEQQHKKINSYL